jgi:energy-coupling factor transport system substrate-specific component
VFKFNTKTLVATAIGAALFTVLFMYVKIPSPVANTEFHTAYAIAAFSLSCSDPYLLLL